MTYDITAYDENGLKIAYLRMGMGRFRQISEQGYDWFKLIDAWGCDGGVSGMGVDREIKLVKLMNAMDKLKNHDTKGRFAQASVLSGKFIYDIWSSKKRFIRRFMRKCINWCILNKKSKILIGFY